MKEIDHFSFMYTISSTINEIHSILTEEYSGPFPARLVVDDHKFLAKTVFFSHTNPASSNNTRSYTIVSAPAE